MYRASLLILAALSLFACQKRTQETATASATARISDASAQEHLYNVSFPLLVAAAQQSDETLVHYGFTVKDAEGGRVVIDYIHPQFPIADSDLEVGDQLISLDGRPLARLDANDVHRLMWQLGLDERKSVALAAVRGGRVLIPRIEGRPATRHRVELTDNPGVDVLSDSDRLLVSRDTLQYVENEHQLALLIGHVIAHDLMGHQRRSAGAIGAALLVPDASGQLPTFDEITQRRAGVEGFPLEIEQEADRIALRLVEQSGFSKILSLRVYESLAAAPKQGVEVPMLYNHPLTPARLESAREVIR